MSELVIKRTGPGARSTVHRAGGMTGWIATTRAADRPEAARQSLTSRNDYNDYRLLVSQNQTDPRPRMAGRMTLDSRKDRLELTADRLGGAGGGRNPVAEAFARI